MTPFTPDGAVSDLVIGHASAVLPDVVIEDARLIVRGGRIAHVGPHPPGASCDLDVRGAYLLPGLIDVHSDMLSREMRPRPGVVLDPSLAIASAGARLRAAGTTTVLHGLAFQERSIVGTAIDSPAASELSEALACTDDRQVDHQVLHRLDVRCEYGRELLEKELEPRAELLSRPADRSGSPAPEGRGAGVPVVSYEDHTPGQGQFADPMTMQRWLVLNEGMSQDDAADHVEWWRSSREKRQGVRDRVLAWLESLARKGLIRLFGHDLATRDDVEAAAALGCSVAEFPTTLEAARAARDQGMLVIAGAPNVVRGRSHTGNVSAAELVSAGLVEENEKQLRLVQELSRKQTEQGLTMRDQTTIQEAMERSDMMYRQLLMVSRGLVESSAKNGSNVAEISEKMLASLEEMRKHLHVLVGIKTDIHLRSEDVERIAEPVSAALKSYVDSSMSKLKSETKEMLETNLAQTSSKYTQTLEDLVQRQEAAADRAEEAAEEVRQGLAAQEAARGWQNQAIATLGAIGLQAATVILGALVILGPIAAAFGLTDAPGYMQWLLDFGGQGIGHGVLAVLLTVIFVSVVAVLIVAGYYLLDGVLQGRVGIRSLHDLWDYAKRVRARGSGEDQEPNVGS
ncbi:hypothetical protein [Corynebacterium sp. Marseille-P4611]|uniref:hypothetical protein n=1 Tax=Corynebacterium sp. Marseille-P4611 TaxID=2866575 RepID=UPI001CE47A95|nr:hypothetical protein [Corynebacterium sp. Marseille-P4611]